MEDTQAKNFFEVKEMKLSRGLTIQKEKRWERADFELTFAILDQDKIGTIKQDGDAILKAYVENFEKSLSALSKNVDIDLSKISWHVAEGQRGPFERSVDRENSEFIKAVNFLMDVRAANISGYYVWLFKDNKTLGRKVARK